MPVDIPAEPAEASAKTTIASFAKDVLARLASIPDAGALRFNLRWKVDFLLTAISATTAAQSDAAPAAGVLGDTLNQAVASS